MATYFVASGGSNTAPYETWAKAATSLATALAAASNAGDMVVIQYDGVPSGDAELAADVTYTFAADNVQLIASTNSGTSTVTPTAMGAGNWIGNSTTNRGIIIAAPNRKIFVYGVTLRTSGTTADSISLASSDGMHIVYESCYIWCGNTNGNWGFTNNSFASDAQAYLRLTNTTLRFGSTLKPFSISGKFEMVGGSIASAGSVPASGVFQFSQPDPGGASIDCIGVDLSHAGGNSLVGDSTTTAGVARFSQCKLGASYVMLATQTNLNRSSAEVYVFDCASGDTHGLFGYANAMGSVVSDTGIYFTSGSAAQSWKIVTTANCSYYTPFETPWFGYYNSTLSAVTPYIEILRDGSATEYQDDEVWIDVLAKTTTGSAQSSLSTDSMALLGTPANQAAGAGTGSWTGEGGTAWSGKIGLGASITPAEVGHIQARIVVGEPSVTVYADPQIRT